jgi:hypothetical protein
MSEKVFCKHKTVEIVDNDGGTFEVKVFELDVITIAKSLHILEGLSNVNNSNVQVLQYVGNNTDVVLDMLEGVTSLKKDIKNIGGTNFIIIIEAFMEVNSDFLSKIQDLLKTKVKLPKSKK